MNYNPLNIPSLQPMYDSVAGFVKEHQGDKGFIYTGVLTEAESIYAMVYTGEENLYVEVPVAAIRVKDDDIQVLCDPDDYFYYSPEGMITEDATANSWRSIHYDDSILYLNTIFSIAELLHLYLDD